MIARPSAWCAPMPIVSKPLAAHKSHPAAQRRALRTIAVFEAIKGATALAASLGLLGVLHRDLHQLAEALIGHFGLQPGAHYPSLILHEADVLQDANLRSLVLLATGYVLLRFFEAYGLWFERIWGQWLGALSGALYVPFEFWHLLYRPSLAGAVVLLVNLVVIGFLAWQLSRELSKTH